MPVKLSKLKPNPDNIKISDLIPDDKNYNKGNALGNSLIEKSLRKLGAGRSILLDKNNRIIAGNKTIENAGAIGLEDVQIVESDGKRIIAVKRMDIDLDSTVGREMALADNATAKANIAWDTDALSLDWSTEELADWALDIPDFNTDKKIISFEAGEYQKKFELVVECENEPDQQKVFELLTKKGYKCRVLQL